MPRKSIKKENTKAKKQTPPSIEEPTDEAVDYRSAILNHYDKQKKSSPWLVLSVASLVIIIFIMWGWSTTTRISLAGNWNSSADKQLLDRTRNNWDEMFAKNENNEKIRQSINDLAAQITSAVNSTTATTTNISPTSTASTTLFSSSTAWFVSSSPSTTELINNLTKKIVNDKLTSTVKQK